MQAISAQVQDCRSGFGQRGEFSGYAPLSNAKLTHIAVHGKLATVEVNTVRGPATLHFLDLGGGWHMLVAGS